MGICVNVAEILLSTPHSRLCKIMRNHWINRFNSSISAAHDILYHSFCSHASKFKVIDAKIILNDAYSTLNSWTFGLEARTRVGPSENIL